MTDDDTQQKIGQHGLHDVVDGDYRGVPVGQPPRVVRKENRRRVLGNQSESAHGHDFDPHNPESD